MPGRYCYLHNKKPVGLEYTNATLTLLLEYQWTTVREP